MSKAKRRLRSKLVRGPGILRVFSSSYKYKEEAKADRARRRGKGHAKASKLQITTQRSIHAISTPFGGMNK